MEPKEAKMSSLTTWYLEVAKGSHFTPILEGPEGVEEESL